MIVYRAALTLLLSACLPGAVARGDALAPRTPLPAPRAWHLALAAPPRSAGAAQVPASMRMSSMSEADWDANDRNRERRYQLDRALDWVGITPGMTVGEVGAGAGYVVFKLAGRVGTQGKVYAEDISASLLEMLKTRAGRRGLANIDTVVGAPDDPRLPAATFDLVFMHATIQFIDERVALFRALAPSLKRGGKIVVIEQPREEYLETFRQAGLKVDRMDATIAPPFTIYVLSR